MSRDKQRADHVMRRLVLQRDWSSSYARNVESSHDESADQSSLTRPLVESIKDRPDEHRAFYAVKMDRCSNCRVPCDGTYCRLCQTLTECVECGRRLSALLYTQSNEVCNTCMRRRNRAVHRTALDGVVEEFEIPTSETDVDINVFLEQREDEITRVLEEAINRHG